MPKHSSPDPFAPLREAAEQLPPCPVSADLGTPAAVRAFEAEFGAALPAKLVMRLIRASEMPAPLLAELLQPRAFASRKAAQRAADRFMALWNHTPRAEHNDATPQEVATGRR